jgi:hypothetical protein
MTPKRREKILIGWSEAVALPDWGISHLNAKVDTGARTSALHVEDLVESGPGHVRFNVVVSLKPHIVHPVRAKVVRWGRMRSSTGHASQRLVVRTRLRLGTVEKDIDISLISREKMRYRMLLGRQALARDFIVDVARRNLQQKQRAGKVRRRSTR